MEQPTYKMNRGAILTQGWRGLAHGMNEVVKSKKKQPGQVQEPQPAIFQAVIKTDGGRGSGDVFSRGVEAHGVQAGVVTILRQ